MSSAVAYRGCENPDCDDPECDDPFCGAPPPKRGRILTPVIPTALATPAHNDVVNSSDVPTLSDAALYGPIGKWVKRLEPLTDAPVPSMLFHNLAIIGAMLGRDPYVNLLGHEQHTNLYVLVIGESSAARKGTAFEIARLIGCGADPNLDARFLSGIASGEGLIQRLTEREGEGSLIVEDEFDRFIAVKDMKGNSLSPRLRTAFYGVPLNHQTKSKAVSLSVSDYHCGLLGHITPRALKVSELESRNGFWNRFLFCLAKPTKLFPPSKSALPTGAATAIGAELKLVLKRAAEIGECGLTEAGAKALDAIQPVRGDTIFAELQKRKFDYILRVALIFAVCDNEIRIDQQHIEAGKAVWDYSADTLQHLMGDVIDEKRDVRQAIVDALSSGPQPSKALEDHLRGEGYTSSEIRRGREKLGITTKAKTVYPQDGRYYCKLPSNHPRAV